MSDSNPKCCVITVHGVNTKGEWQEEVAEALKIFFKFEPIKYNRYRWFCGTELVLNPFIWLTLGTAFGSVRCGGLGEKCGCNLGLYSGDSSAVAGGCR